MARAVPPVRTPLPASVEDAFAVLSGRAYVAAKRDALQDDSRLVSHETLPGGGVRVAVSRQLPEGTPAPLQRFLPKDGRVVQTDMWEPAGADGSRRGTWVVTAEGVPAQLGGTLLLEPADGGCVQVVEGSVKVRVPVVGGRVEGYLADLTGKLAAREGQVARDLLGG